MLSTKCTMLYSQTQWSVREADTVNKQYYKVLIKVFQYSSTVSWNVSACFLVNY